MVHQAKTVLLAAVWLVVATLAHAQAPSFTSASTATFTVGTPGSFTLTASGAPAPTFSVGVPEGLPAGLSLNSTTGEISGTPSAGTGGIVVVGFVATNSNGIDTQLVTFTIDEAPTITNAASTTFVVGTAGSFQFTASGHPAETYSTADALPAGVTLDGSGLLSGTPGAGTGGTYPITVTATNGIGADATQAFTLTVNQAPAITSAASTTFVVGSVASFNVTSTGFPARTYSVTPALPSGLSLNTATGAITGTPDAGTGGVYALTLGATNGVGTDASQSFTLTINEIPVITSGATASVVRNQAGSFTVTATGFPVPTFSVNVPPNLPAGLSLNSTTGVVSGTPTAAAGDYPVVFLATNTAGVDSIAFTITITEAPAITSGNSTTFVVGAPGTFTVTASGVPAASFALGSGSVALPTGVTLNGTTGVLSGTPADGTGGTYALVLEASNGVGSPASQNFTLTVNENPVITSAASTTFTVGSAGSFQFTADGHPAATFSTPDALPSGVTLNGSGLLSGTPGAGTGGTYVLNVTATNGVGADDTQVFTLTVNQAPAITSANNATFVVGAPGTFTVTASGVPAASFALGSGSVALPTGVSLNPTTGVLSGTPADGTGGTYALVLEASNGVGSPASQNFTLTVNENPVITSAASTTFTVGTAGSFQFTTDGHPAATYSTADALPSGVTLNGSGLLSGTPGAGTGGTYVLNVTATNGIGADDTQVFTLTVNQAPAITSANNATFTVDTAGTFTVTSTGFPTRTYAVSPALPSGLSLNTTTGEISGTPADVTGGVYNLTLTASNGVAPAGTQAFTLTINEEPLITSSSGTTFIVGTAGSFQFTAEGHPAPTYATADPLPTGVTLNGAGLLSGTPGAGTGGTYEATVVASNGVGSDDPIAFTLTVNEAPAITSANNHTFTVGTAGSFTVTSTGFPTRTYAVSPALPSGLSLNTTTGAITGTPADGTGGVYNVTLTASNGVTPDATQAFTLTIDENPVITSASSTTFVVGTAGSFQFTADGNPAATFSTPDALPAGVTLNGSGLLSGTPGAGTGGTYVLNVTATNGVGVDGTQVFTLTVNQAPAITSAASTTFVVGTAGSFTVTSTGFPANTYAVSPALPSGLSLNTTTGEISGTPADATGGTYNVTLTASNGVTPDATQAFTLTVNENPGITSASSVTSFTVGVAGSFQVTADGFPAASFSTTDPLPTGLALNGAGLLAGTPADGTGGEYFITITAVNGINPDATQVLALTVNESPEITSAATATFEVGSAGSFTVTSSGFPAATYTVSTGTLPTGLALNASTGVIAGTPADGTGGMVSITVTAANGVTPDASQVITLTVNEAPAITSAASTTFVVGTAGSFQMTADGHPASTFSTVSALPTGVTLNSSGLLSGTPADGTGGTYAVTVTASNGINPDATQAFTLTVSESPEITSAASATFEVGTAGSFTVTSSGFPASTYAVSPALPSGLALNTTTGVISGTPADGLGGVYNVTLTASNGITPDATQAFTLTVNEAPAITSAASTTFVVGTAGSFQMSADGFPASTFSTSSALPTGVTLNASGLLSGTPADGTGGTYAVTVTASNGINPDATQAFTLTVSEAPEITSAASATFEVGAAGSFTVTSTGFPASTYAVSPALPSGLALNTTTGVISGTPADGLGGVYNVTLTASNGITPDATQAFTLTVNEAPAITSAATTTFAVGVAGSFQVTADGFPASTFSTSSALPTGVTLNASGLLSGTPAVGTGGSYAVTIVASNGIAPNASQSFTLLVNEAPAITSPSSATFTVGTAGSLDVDATGFPAPTYAITLGTLPTGLVLNATTGVIAGTPADGTGGVVNVTVTASNGIAPDASQVVTLTVNEAPEITSAATTTFAVGVAGSFQVTGDGFPGPLTYSTSSALPTGVTLNSSGLLSGTPAVGTGGSYAVTLVATNGIAPAGTQSFTLLVNEAPVITSATSATFTVGVNSSFTVAASGFPAPLYSVVQVLPAGLTLNASTGALSGEPADGTGGVYTLTLVANNGIGVQSEQTFTLTVNEAPAISSASSTTFTVGQANTFQFTAQAYPAATFSTSSALPSGVTLNASGLLSGNPASGTGGVYTVTVTASNGIAPASTQTFTLNVHQAPTITSAASATFEVGVAGSFTVTSTGFPAATYAVAPALPAGLSLNATTGVLSGTPADGAGGVHTVTITAANGTAPDATQSFTLTVNEAPAITSASSATFTVGTAGSFQVTSDGFPAATYAVTGSLPAGVTLDASGLLSGTPAAATGGTYVVTITAANGFSPDATQSFTLTVGEAPAITSAATATFTVGTAGSTTFVATGFPAPTYALTGSLPTGLVLNGTTGVLSGTPAAATGGTYVLTLTATNGVGSDATQEVTLTVNEAPAITSVATAEFTVGTAGSFTVTSTGFPARTFAVSPALPAGLTLDSVSGVLSGTPEVGTGAAYTLTLTASNGTSPDATQAFTLTVNEAPTVSITGPTEVTLGASATYTATGTGFPLPTVAWRFDGDVVPGEVGPSYTFTAQLASAGVYSVTVSNATGSATSNEITLVVNVPATITSPLAVTGSDGTPFSYQATATGTGPITWSALGLPAGLAIDADTGLITGTPSVIGVIPVQLTATNVTGDTTETLVVELLDRDLLRLGNVSLRANVQTGDGVAITGFVIEGGVAKRILLRAVGPTLAGAPFNVPGTLPNPRLRVFRGSELIYENDNWEDSINPSQIADTSAALGAFPLLAASDDAAFIGDFDPGVYTVLIDDLTGGTGTALIELYEIDTNGRLTNLSSRAYTGNGGDVVISGFVIGGDAPKQVLIRGVGPTLASDFGIASAVAQPRLVLYNADENVIAQNDGWSSSPNASEIASVGAAAGAFPLPSDSEDAALLVTLPPGVYTVHAVGDTGTGVVLLEVYEVP